MKWKRGMEINPLSLVVVMAILGILLFVIIKGVFPIFTEKQAPYLRAQTEIATTDCDGDQVIGVTDNCPCDPESRSKSENCGKPSQIATKNCPNACKNEKSGNA
jgi:hypothetical protein